jgi:hypothetical protein
MRIDEITKEPLEKCLLMLAYQADVAYLEELMYKEALKKG